LPRQIQKKTREFLKKFKENPISSAINYEKINTFKDQSLRTVRIDSKYRAIVQAQDKGVGYHLLWVDNHDEAMDWAKNKVFSWNHATQAFQLFEKHEEQIQIREASGITLFNQISEKDLLSIGTPNELLELVRTIKSKEDLDAYKPNLPTDVYEYLYYLADGIPLSEILEDIESGKEEKNPMQSSNALKHTCIVTDDAQLEDILNGNFEKWKLFLHPSQRNLAYRDYNGPVKVTGGAGTGKTVCALHRIKYLVDKLDVFDKPILFTTYTKSLTQYLQETIKGLGIPEDRVEIINIDKLIYDLANNSEYKVFKNKVGFFSPEQESNIWRQALEKQASQFDTEFYDTEYNQVILPQNITTETQYQTASRIGRNSRIGKKDKEEIWKVVVEFQALKSGNYSKIELCNMLTAFFSKQKNKPFSYLVCDEIQDFSNPELSLLRSLVLEKENDMFMVGDPYQNIYRKSLNFAKSGIVVKGRRSKKLKINYRTTEEIKSLSMRVVSNLIVNDFDDNKETLQGYLSLLHGATPEYITFTKPEQEDQFVLERVNDLISSGKVLPSEICICSRTNNGLDGIKRILNKSNLKYFDLSSSKNSPNAINVSTFHNVKGHEFKVVIMIGISEDSVPYKNFKYNDYTEKQRDEYHQQERSLLYVVCTRAIYSLIITGVGDRTNWF
jgi:DNA helicase IV